MGDNTWHDGPPPSLGWWPASSMRVMDAYRWWNGKEWSVLAFERDSVVEAARSACIPTICTGVQWRERPSDWPERSRT